MPLISNDFRDGDYLAFEHVRAEVFGFGVKAATGHHICSGPALRRAPSRSL